MRLSPRPIVLAFFVLTTALPAVQAGELADHGPEGIFFHDIDTGLYWFDTAFWESIERSQVDFFVTDARLWSWATGAEIDALVGQTAPDGSVLEDIMGPRQASIGAGGPRWIGYHAGTAQPDGWLLQSETPPYTELSTSGSQSSVDSFTHGAWLVAADDPVAAPRLADLGDQGEFFHDQFTDLYWYDPAHFEGLTRADVETWLADHADWRWATAAEIRGLVGMFTVGDVDATTVLGDAQAIVGSGGARWIGYYAQATQPDGMLLEASILSSRVLITAAGTQSGVAAWDPGAWVVSEVDPTPVEQRTWSGVKGMWR